MRFGGQIVHLVSRKGGKFYLWKNDKNKVKLNLTEKIYQKYIFAYLFALQTA